MSELLICPYCFGSGFDIRSGNSASKECRNCGGSGKLSYDSIVPAVIDPMVCRFCGIDFGTGFKGLYQVSVHIGAAWRYEGPACPDCIQGLEKAFKTLIERHQSEKRAQSGSGRNIIL